MAAKAAPKAVPVPRPGRGVSINRAELTRLRIGRGWTPGELAGQLGVAGSTVSRIETGRRRPSLEMIGKLAAALGVTVDDLLAKPEK